MGNTDSKGKILDEEIIIKCSLQEMVKHFFKDYAVIWHDPNVNSPENQQYILQLKQFCEVLTFTEWEKALVSMQQSKVACHVITSGTNGEVFVEEIYEIPHVTKIYVFCMNKEYHSTWAQRYQKISCVETNIQNLINQIKQNLIEWYREISSLKVNLPAFAPIFNDGDKSEMSNLHRYLRVITSFENRAQAKNDLLNLSRLIYTDPNNKKHITDFDKYYTTYCQTQILRWYTRESFLYKVTNNCLRIGTADSIQYCRLILKDLEQAIKEQYQTKSKNCNGLLYRGAYLSQEEWASLRENQDKEIEMHGFLSVSKEKSVALNFMKTSSSQKVLITIIVPKGPNKEEQGFAEIEEFSLFPYEREILFNVRSRFTVLETEEKYSPELPYRHLVLLYGAQGLRKYIAKKGPVYTVSASEMVGVACSHCTQEIPQNFLFRLLDKPIYYCKNCIENANNTAVFLTISVQNTPTVTETKIKGCFLKNSANQFNNLPFYGYKCSECQTKKQKSYFICTDCCSTENKLTWCENCFTNTLSCVQSQHNILLETTPFQFWCQKMSEDELYHLQYHDALILVNSDYVFRQPCMFLDTHNYDKAVEYYNLYLQRSQTKDIHHATALNNLGIVYRHKQNYGKALEYYLKSIQLKRSDSRFDSFDLADSYCSIGNCYNLLTDYTKALEFHFKALDIYKNSDEAQHDLATSYLAIGSVYQNQREFSRAWEFFQKAQELFLVVYGEKNPMVATCYSLMGMVLKAQKEYAKALEYLLKALNAHKFLYGEKHPEVAISYNNIASVFSDQEDHDKAVEYYLKSLEIAKSLNGEKHPDVAISYRNIALTFYEKKEYVKALELFLKALEIRKLFYGENSPEVAGSYYHIGIIYSEQNEYLNALEYQFKSLEVRRSLYGENHSDVALAYEAIGDVYFEQKEYTKAIEYQLKSLEIKKSLYGEKHADIAFSYEEIGHVYLEQKEYTKALEYYSRSLEMKRLFFEENTNEIAASYSCLGKALNNQGEYNSALEHHEKALSIRKTIFGENNFYTAISYDRIADVYMNQKEYAKALEYCQKSLEIRDSIYGKDHADTIESQTKLLEIESLCHNR